MTRSLRTGRSAALESTRRRDDADTEVDLDDARLRALLDAAGDGIIAVDSRGRFTYVSATATALSGITPVDTSPEEWPKIFGLFLPDETTPMPVAEVPLVRAMRGESTDEISLFVQNNIVPAGRHVTMVVRPWTDPENGTTGGIATVRDSTARIAAQREARKQSWFLESIVENVPAMIFVKEATELRFERFNRAGEALLGMDRTALLGKNDYDFFPKEQADFFTKHDRDALAGSEVLDIPEEPIQTAHGARWLHTKKVPVRDDAGEPKYLLGISLDITARKLAEDELRRAHDEMEERVRDRTRELREREAALFEQAEKLQVILDSLEEGVMVIQPDGKLQMLNRAANSLVGPMFEDPMVWSAPRPGVTLYHADGVTPLTTEDRPAVRAFHGEIVDEMDVVVRRDSEEGVLIRVGARPLRNEAGEVIGALVTVRDITEKWRMEQIREQSSRLEEQNRTIVEANRLKTEFLANMSHELRTPLNAIIGFAQLLRDGNVPPDAPEFREFLTDIVQSGWQLLALINDVLDLAKVEAGKIDFHPEQVDIGELLQDVAHLQRTRARTSEISIAVEADPNLGEVETDPARMTQIINNYLSNALKFTPKGGRIVLRALPNGASGFRVEVEDTGIGIAPEDISRLFVEFQQLEAGAAKTHSGTGLGLALTKRLVEAQGGSVGVTSALGKGSTFYAVFPRIALVGHVLPSMRVYPNAAGTGPWALVVDNDVNDQRLVVQTLTASNWSVQTAATATQALDRASERKFDAITLKLALPDDSGLQVLAAIRRGSGPNVRTPVIAVGVARDPSQLDSEFAAVVRAFGVHDWLPKPLTVDVLRAGLQRAIPDAMTRRQGVVLVVDQDPIALRATEAMLHELGIRAILRQEGATALADLPELDAVILDLLMPGVDGFTFLENLRAIPAYRRVPLLVTKEDRPRMGPAGKATAGSSDGHALLAELKRLLNLD
jgi:PAS domain S-box-containing protein